MVDSWLDAYENTTMYWYSSAEARIMCFILLEQRFTLLMRQVRSGTAPCDASIVAKITRQLCVFLFFWQCALSELENNRSARINTKTRGEIKQGVEGGLFLEKIIYLRARSEGSCDRNVRGNGVLHHTSCQTEEITAVIWTNELSAEMQSLE